MVKKTGHMKISKSPRVEYTHNPLAEVVCQVRFAPTPVFENDLPEALVAHLREDGFVAASQEEAFSISIAMSPAGQQDVLAPQQVPTSRVFHFSSEDGIWKASVAVDFCAITCTQYRNWEEFYPRFVRLSEKVASFSGPVRTTRVGLRYKDIIERDSLGLGTVPWHRLIAPFLLGPMACKSLCDDQFESDEHSYDNFVSQSTIQLDDCALLLQSILLKSTTDDRRAFLIDSDFYFEGHLPEPLYRDSEELIRVLTTLHDNAGSLFRRSITEELHVALGPK